MFVDKYDFDTIIKFGNTKEKEKKEFREITRLRETYATFSEHFHTI